MQITTKIDLPRKEVVDAIKMYLYDQGVGYGENDGFSIEHFEDGSVVVTIVDGE